MTLIQAKNLVIGYEKALTESFSFEIPEGDFVAIVGDNGAGKSTLIKTILKFIKPLKGTIDYCNGLKSTTIGYLPQQTEISKDFPALVSEVVLSGLQGKHFFHPFYTKNDKKELDRVCSLLAIDDIQHERYQKLSGGQKQRVLLARALLSTDKILLLDEPVSGLDPEATTNFYNLIHDLNDKGVTIITVTHDVEHGLSGANTIIHLSNHKVVIKPKTRTLK